MVAGAKMIVLDRDGVINVDSNDFIKSAEEWSPIPGSLDAIARLFHAGFHIFIVSNQSGLGRGLFTIDRLNEIHKKLREQLSVRGAQIDAIFFCPHAPEAKCGCRKPAVGLLRDLEDRFQVDLTGVPIVGDSFRDIVSALGVGADPILVLTGKGMGTLKERERELAGVPCFDNLSAAVDAILREENL